MSNPARTLNPSFKEVHVLRHPAGPMISITKRLGDDRHSFAILKAYTTPEGKHVRAGFMNRRHIAGIRVLLSELEEWLDAEADRASAVAAP